MVNGLLSKILIFLIIDFKILGRVEKKKILLREHHFFFLYFQTATCYNSSLVFSRLDPALVKAAYNIACPYAVLWILERVRTRLARFSAHAKATQAQDISFPLLVTNLNGLFSKISLRIHQTYTKEKCFLQHGFSENGGVRQKNFIVFTIKR